MKRNLIAACLGIALGAANSSFAQTTITFTFANYLSYPVQYDPDPAKVPPGTAGQPVDSSFRVKLLCGIGSITDPSQLVDTGISASIDPRMPGYFRGGSYALRVSGPVTFMVEAWESTGPFGDFDTSLIRGASPMFQQSNGMLNLPGPIYVSLVPEPSLVGIAGLALLSVAIRTNRR